MRTSGEAWDTGPDKLRPAQRCVREPNGRVRSCCFWWSQRHGRSDLPIWSGAGNSSGPGLPHTRRVASAGISTRAPGAVRSRSSTLRTMMRCIESSTSGRTSYPPISTPIRSSMLTRQSACWPHRRRRLMTEHRGGCPRLARPPLWASRCAGFTYSAPTSHSKRLSNPTS